jgi:hypothetical protein
MTRGQQRHSACIHNSQTLDTNNPSSSVHHGHGVVRLTHLARARCVPHSYQCAADRVENLLVGLHLSTRSVFIFV